MDALVQAAMPGTRGLFHFAGPAEQSLVLPPPHCDSRNTPFQANASTTRVAVRTVRDMISSIL